MASFYPSSWNSSSTFDTNASAPFVKGSRYQLMCEEKILEDCEAAGQQISDIMKFEDNQCCDNLYDAVHASKPSDVDPPWPTDWPPVVDVTGKRLFPRDVLDRYVKASEGTVALCGIFPTIRQAWATVDNSFFIWNFNRSDSAVVEYSEEQQLITAVGLAPVRPGVFIEGIQHILVLTTPVEIVLIGVCISSEKGPDAFNEISLVTLSQYAMPSDGITFTCVASSDHGRIFLGGKDGHLYEVHYGKAGWGKRCYKSCISTKITSTLASWVVPSVFMFGATDSVLNVTIDEERHILYATTQASKIHVYDLGKNGDSHPKKVVENVNISDMRDHSGKPRRARQRGQKFSIVSLNPISIVESKYIHLVVQFSDGLRMYLSTQPTSPAGYVREGTVGGIQRPTCLSKVGIRTARLKSGAHVAGGTNPSQRPPETQAGKVEVSMYSSGVLTVAETFSESSSSLLVAVRDWSSLLTESLPISAARSPGPRVQGPLRETLSLTELGGRPLAMADVLPFIDLETEIEPIISGGGEGMRAGKPSASELTRAKKLWARNVLGTQHSLPRRKILALSTTGMTEVTINRPVDTLQKLLESSQGSSALELFFKHYGKEEASAMCLLLAAGIACEGDDGLWAVPPYVAERATTAFENTRLVGIAKKEKQSSFGNLGGSQGDGIGIGSGGGGNGGNGFDMGQMVQEETDEYSGACGGLWLCTARLLRPVWEQPLVVVNGSLPAKGGSVTGSGIITLRQPLEALRVMGMKVNALEQFLRSRREKQAGLYRKVWVSGGGGRSNGSSSGGWEERFHRAGSKGLGPATPLDKNRVGVERLNSNKRLKSNYPEDLVIMEMRYAECVRRLLRRSAEALLLLRILGESHFPKLIQELDPTFRARLCNLTFRQFVCTDEGDQLAEKLVTVLMEYHLRHNTMDEVSTSLRKGCTSFFSESEYMYYRAYEMLEKAARLGEQERNRLAKEAFGILKGACDVPEVLTVCKRFQDLGIYEAVLELPLRRAHILDPTDDALNENLDDETRQTAAAKRHQCYDVVVEALTALTGGELQSPSNGPQFAGPRPTGVAALNSNQRRAFAIEIIQRGVQSADKLFHERLYAALVELGMENELLEMGGSDLEDFLRGAGNLGTSSGREVVSRQNQQVITGDQGKYLELLAKLYASQRHHLLAAHVYLRLAERNQPEGGYSQPGGITLEQRLEQLSNAVLQAKSSQSVGLREDMSRHLENYPDLQHYQDKQKVLRFQIRIRDMLLQLSTKNGGESSQANDMSTNFTEDKRDLARRAKEKAEELQDEFKNISQLYNDYAMPFQLWEMCLEILNFSSFDSQMDSDVASSVWQALIQQGLQEGGVTEACLRVGRVGQKMEPVGSASLPLEMLAQMLEEAAQDAVANNRENVRPEDVPLSLLSACRDNAQPVQKAYERLLARPSGPLQGSPIRLRLLRSEAFVLLQWVRSLEELESSSNWSRKTWMDTSRRGDFGFDLPKVGGAKSVIANAHNRVTVDVQRLAVLPSEIEDVLQLLNDVHKGLRRLTAVH